MSPRLPNLLDHLTNATQVLHISVVNALSLEGAF